MSRDSSDALEDLRYRREKAHMGGGIKRQENIRASGRGTARDRIRNLLDEDSFVEIDTFLTHRTSDHGMFMHETLGDGVVCGHGTVDGRRIYCFAQDFSVHGGSMGEMHAKKISKVVEMAERSKVPIVGIWDGGGQRAQDGVASLGGTLNVCPDPPYVGTEPPEVTKVTPIPLLSTASAFDTATLKFSLLSLIAYNVGGNLSVTPIPATVVVTIPIEFPAVLGA